ncbi:LysM peptidoglycan-binding domain-containing protein [Granulosicoccus sp. 3-233]|uniref:LysM peptidoglycan-binding domain-containing protein n=1 Tax=Granulosicoccus sp. 3-233 TaxID=3417969 RepID=UPI003D34EA98
MQKNSCLSIVVCFAASICAGCATPFAQQEASTLDDSTPSEIRHIIAPGDRLSDIALKYTGKVSQWEAIAAYNDITDPRTLRIGDSITIPPSMIPRQDSIRDNATDLAINANASTNVKTGSLALQRARDTEADAIDVKVVPVTTNRTFQMERLDESDIGTTQTQGVNPPRIKVIGTYYPKGVYQQPASYSRLMMRVAPGTVFELDREVNDWYKVITSEGTGYLRTIDGKLIVEE